ncbi:MAG: hypothetical protein GF418_01085 [Chitinivibrionales bacterium]|nr:hypothetical protein [Chitinivibrionales bacterium]MBD3394196.1 hypothetical protein [Chitinivibrionales bacterium]
MSKRSRIIVGLGLAAVAACAAACWVTSARRAKAFDPAAADVAMLPWVSVGGCGAGGSGGGGGGVRWIGKGVSGGLIDAEIMYTATMGQNYNQKQVKTRLSWKPTWTVILGATVPIVSKVGSLQPQTNYDDKTEVTGGLADVIIDITKNFGMQGQYSILGSVTLPTGQYDIKRGKENEELYLPTSLQKGSGLLGLSLGLGYTRDVEDGLWVGDLTFSYPVALNLRGENEHFDYTDEQLDAMAAEDRKRFDYVFKPYGENKLGAYTPPSLTLAVYYGYRGVEHFVHSFGITFTGMFGVAWVPNFTATTDIDGYDPFPDPDHKAWTASLNYGLEFSRDKFPIFVAVSLPINDSKNDPDRADKYNDEPFGKWGAPDWEDFLQSWTVGIGVKSTMF